MGNSLISPCFHPDSPGDSAVKLVFYGGATRLLPGGHLAADLIFQFPDCSVFHADSFFIGRPVPFLSISDELLLGETYFILPTDRFPTDTLTAASLAKLNGGKWRSSQTGKFPFEYVKGEDGRKVVKVLPDFIMQIITVDGGGEEVSEEICSTPELRKHYEQLVGRRNRLPWSPKLETITESKVRASPFRLLSLEKR